MIMNPTQMHAAERLANQAIKTGTIPSIEDAMEAIQQSLKENTINPSKISEAQLAANRANAKHSTGPQSSDAKKRVSLNAVKSALTGRTVLLEGEDTTAYQTLLNDHLKEFTPEGMRETALVQSLTDILWRLDRIPRLEDALIISSRAVMAAANPESSTMSPPSSKKSASGKPTKSNFAITRCRKTVSRTVAYANSRNSQICKKSVKRKNWRS